MRGRLGFLANRPSKTRSDGPYVGFHADSTNRGAVEGKKGNYPWLYSISLYLKFSTDSVNLVVI
jgi:hypothetical protein